MIDDIYEYWLQLMISEVDVPESCVRGQTLQRKSILRLRVLEKL